MPHLQPWFKNPVAITMRTITVGGNTFDVYVSHPEDSYKKSDSIVLVIKRRWGTYPSNMQEGDQVQVVLAIDRCFAKIAVDNSCDSTSTVPMLCPGYEIVTGMVVTGYKISTPPERGSGPISVHCDLYHVNSGVAIPSVATALRQSLAIRQKTHIVESAPPFKFLETAFDIFYTCHKDEDGIAHTEAIFMHKVGLGYADINSSQLTSHVFRAIDWQVQ
ncbi:hypothetical protein HWV62_3038 [Athelia sp. TMB]|nr:hypothetical protein HWV62_3038 [Athelia sp. TMB]